MIGSIARRAVWVLCAAFLAVLCSGCTYTSYARHSMRGALPAGFPHDVPATDVASYQFAARLASDGNCPDALTILGVLSESWTSQANHADAAAFLVGYCALYHDGDLDRAEQLGRDIFARGNANASQGAALVSSALLHRCDLEEARNWLYLAEQSTQSYLPRSALVGGAAIDSRAGRPGAARAALGAYVRQYPADWFMTVASHPPEGVYYDRPAQMAAHAERRAGAIVLLAAYDRIRVPAEDRAHVDKVLMTDIIDETDYGPGYRSGVGRGEMALSRIEFAAAALAGSQSIGLSDARAEELAQQAFEAADDLMYLHDACQEFGAIALTRFERSATRAGVTYVRTASGSGADPALVDRDLDGLPDAQDLCPNEVEVFNGVDDHDGCPDEALAEVLERQIVIHDRVRFETGSATLRPESTAVLDQVARVLVAYPELRRVQIDGHTDRHGDDAYNLDLSTRRAQSVLEYLVAAGVDEGRLSTRGFGEAIPLAFGDDEAAWAMNRRVEFTILDADPVLVPVGRSESP